MQEEGVDLTPELLKSFACGKVSKQHSKDIIDVDFSDDGTLLYTCDETTLNVYETISARKVKTLFLKTCEIVRLCHTHNNYAVLVGTKKEHEILYWSIHENSIVKKFKGHNDLICGLEMCPPDDFFLTTSRDQTVRLWNLNEMNHSPLSILDLYEYSTCSYPVANFDPKGVVFAVSFTEVVNNITVCRICLYDKSDYEMGAFKSWTKEYSELKVLKFSNCGKLLLCATLDNLIVILDAFEGNELNRFTNFQNENSIIECSLSPDSLYVVSGSESGVIHVWSLTPSEKVIELSGHIEKSQCVKFSPKQALMVSAGRNIFWWIPRKRPT